MQLILILGFSLTVSTSQTMLEKSLGSARASARQDLRLYSANFFLNMAVVGAHFATGLCGGARACSTTEISKTVSG